MPISFPYRIDRTGRTATPADHAALVKELIRQVLFTAPGERVMRPLFGTGVHQLLFAPSGDQAATAAQHLVSGALQQWLASWIEVKDVTVAGEGEELTVTIRYRLRATGDSDTATYTFGT